MIFARLRREEIICDDTIRQHDDSGAVCQRKIEIVRDGDAEFAPECFFAKDGKTVQLLFDV